MEQIEINKLNAFIELGKLNSENKPWERERLQALNTLILRGINTELNSDRISDKLVFRSNHMYKNIFRKAGLKANQVRKPDIREIGSALKKFIFLLWH